MTVSSTNNNTLRILDIVAGTTVDGPGLRTSVYFAGCSHKCPGCHNPQSWDFKGGNEITVDELLERIRFERFNVTFTGGDPIYQIDNLIELAKSINDYGLTIWLYTGFTIEELEGIAKWQELKPFIEAVVDGPFIESRRDIGLQFRGSDNQRIIYLRD